MAMRSWPVAAMIVVAIVAAGASRARADDDALVVIVVVGDGAADVATRVEGQVSDLAVALVRIDDAAWSDHARGDPLAAAARLAASRDARVVVWFEADDATWTVHVAEPAAGRVLSRRVESAGDLASSASAEAVALVVRAALSAIADGGSIGVAPRPPPPVAIEPPQTIAHVATEPRRRTYAALGWTGVAGGAGPRIQHGVVARLGVATRRWRAGVALGVHPPVAVAQPGATMELSRTALGGFAARDLLGDGRAPWLLSLELGAGATRFARVTTGADAPLTATPAAVIWAPTLAPTLRLSRRLGGGARLELSAGADLLLRVPEFGLGTSGGFMTYARVNPVQPQAALLVVVETR